MQRQRRAVVFFDEGQSEVHSRRNSGRGVNIFVTNKDRIWINVSPRGPFDENVTPVPMSCGPAAIEQTGLSKKHCPGADRADPADSSGTLFQPAHDVRVYLILLNRATTGDEQSVDLSAHFPKSSVRSNSQPAVRHKRSLRRRADDFDRIDWRRSRILFAEHFRGASEDLKRPDQIEYLGPRRGYEHDPARCPRGATIVSIHDFLDRMNRIERISGLNSDNFVNSVLQLFVCRGCELIGRGVESFLIVVGAKVVSRAFVDRFRSGLRIDIHSAN